MSSSEPRLPAGDGLSEVRAVQAAFSADDASLPEPPRFDVSPTVATTTARAEQSGNDPPASPSFPPDSTDDDSELLPPLMSLSDMMLEAPPWLISAAVHMLAVIILGLLLIVPQQSDEILLRFAYQDSVEDDLLDSDLELPLDLSEQSFDQELATQDFQQIEDPLVAPPIAVELAAEKEPIESEPTPIRMALTGREKGMQNALLDAYGGTSGTQQAVMEALRWLARNQVRDGSWKLTGDYSDGASSDNDEAATAMALLAFQGAGYTPAGDPKEPFTKVVARGWKSLLEKQDENGNFFQTGPQHSQLYTQALCTIAVCELYGMTSDEQYLDPAQLAIDYCVKIQASEGGWRYSPGIDSDLSVTGWFVMALQSARMAGLEVPSTTLDNIRGFLDRVSRESGSQYAYQEREGATRSMTAEGLLCRQYLGWAHTDGRLQRGADYLLEKLPSWERGDRNVYYWYYATQVCHHMEGHHWRTWNNTMRELLPRHQVRKGRERGSWDPDGDRWGKAGGRLFVTCLSAYMLEVYYRHLPIYRIDLLGGSF